jgi:hypothetical protein
LQADDRAIWPCPVSKYCITHIGDMSVGRGPRRRWDEYWRDVGLPEEDLGLGVDRISDPGGAGPPIWFQVNPEASCNEARIGVTPRGYWRLPRHNSRFRARLGGGVTPRP